MRVLARYQTQELAEKGLAFRGQGEVVFLPNEDFPNRDWALVDQYEPKPVPDVFVCREEDTG